MKRQEKLRFNQVKDTRELVNESLKPVRKYQRKKAVDQYRPERARFKLKIWFLDGNSRIFYSYDLIQQKDSKYLVDEWEGLKKLSRLLRKYEQKMKSGVIFMSLDEDPDTEFTSYDVMIAKKRGVAPTRYSKKLNFDPETNRVKLKAFKS